MGESLRDQLSANLEALETTQTAPEATTGQETTSEPAGQEASASTSAPTEKPGRTSGRARDENGRLLPGKAERQQISAAEPGKASPAPTPNAQTVQAAPAAEAKPRPKYPTTWKKGHESIWDSLDPNFLEEVVRREGDYAKGVSTYKAEYDNIKPLADAVAPYRQILEQNKLDPVSHVGELLKSHHTLVMGSPQEKLQLVARIIQQNRVPIEHLFVRGQDGQIYFNQQLLNQPAPQQAQPQVDIQSEVRNVLVQERANQTIAEMRANTEKYPHFEQVRETMVGLLQSGLADDPDSAYQAALRLPKHSELFEHDQKLVREAEEKRVADEKRKQAEAARRNTVSPRTTTPTAASATPGAKGLRSQLSENFDAVVGSRF